VVAVEEKERERSRAHKLDPNKREKEIGRQSSREFDTLNQDSNMDIL
jgi:hypothetical protein